MESDDEAYRLDIKTDPKTIKQQALWAGIRPGMRVLDVACGAGKTTAVLHHLVQPRGCAIGIDASPDRIAYARKHYGDHGVVFHHIDAREDLSQFGFFDFAWIRFLLQYYPEDSLAIINNVSKVIEPGGILMLVDLDRINFNGLSERLEKTIAEAIQLLCDQGRYDPTAGSRLSARLTETGYVDIRELVSPYHQIQGEANQIDAYNWMKKATVVSQSIDYRFPLYEQGAPEFIEEFEAYIHSPQRSISTPLICARGVKPA